MHLLRSHGESPRQPAAGPPARLLASAAAAAAAAAARNLCFAVAVAASIKLVIHETAGGTHARTTLTTTAEESNSVIVLERVPWIIRKLAAVRIIRDCRYCRRASPARDSARARRDKIVTVISTHSPRNHARDIYLYIYIYCHSHARSLTHSVDRTGHTHTRRCLKLSTNARARACSPRGGVLRDVRAATRALECVCCIYVRTSYLHALHYTRTYERHRLTEGGHERVPRARRLTYV